MHISEALVILWSLADRMDPDSSEPVPADSIVNCSLVKQALYEAIIVLELLQVATPSPKRTVPGNAGTPWTRDEDDRLLMAFDAGEPVTSIAKRHQRSRGAITARLARHQRVVPITYTDDDQPDTDGIISGDDSSNDGGTL